MYKYRLSGELTNILYSMSNSATRFMPHQFIPVTKFLESYTDRLLIADEVGLGKTIESMYIWEELRARLNAKRLLIVVPAILRFKWKMDTFQSAPMPYFYDVDLSELTRQDTKFQKVLEMIRSLIQNNPNEKVVIFSFFRGTVEYLYRQLTKAGIRSIMMLSVYQSLGLKGKRCNI